MNRELSLDLANEHASVRLAEQLASCLFAPLIITFSGDIGVGKTTIIRALLRKMGVDSAIKSPTFSLVESYNCQSSTIHHFDLYRIEHEDELEYLGFRDYFTPDSICCIEWADRAGQALPDVDIHFKLSIQGAGRHMRIKAASEAGKKILAYLAGD